MLLDTIVGGLVAAILLVYLVSRGLNSARNWNPIPGSPVTS